MLNEILKVWVEIIKIKKKKKMVGSEIWLKWLMRMRVTCERRHIVEILSHLIESMIDSRSFSLHTSQRPR